MKTENIFNQKNLSKGGLLGALAGTAASSQFHKDSDSTMRKAAKTGIFASIGYLLGLFLEKLIRRNQ
jgi:hypothetical protein